MNSSAGKSSGPTGIVLNIQRYCSHDGPGIRTNIFLKGCSLRCKWCSNPESIHPKPELAYAPNLCTGKNACGLCLKPPFPEGAFYVYPSCADLIGKTSGDDDPSLIRNSCRSRSIETDDVIFDVVFIGIVQVDAGRCVS